MIKERLIRDLNNPVGAWIVFLGCAILSALLIPSPIVRVLNAIGGADGDSDGMPPIDLFVIGCAIVSLPVGVLVAMALIKMTGARSVTRDRDRLADADQRVRPGWGRSVALSLVAVGFAAIAYAVSRHPRGDSTLDAWGAPEVDMLRVLIPSMVSVMFGACQFVLELKWPTLARQVGRAGDVG
jgi:hypothetical protein